MLAFVFIHLDICCFYPSSFTMSYGTGWYS